MVGHGHGEIRYFTGDWSPDDFAEIRRELERRDVAYTLDGDDMLVGIHHERMVDMIVESVTEE